MHVRRSNASSDETPMVVITFESTDELDDLMVDLDSAYESLNWVPAIATLRTQLAPIAERV